MATTKKLPVTKISANCTIQDHKQHNRSLIYTFIGMLSKAKGQILRVSGILNVLFCDRSDQGKLSLSDTIPIVITNDALEAAQNFVDTACQHAAYLSGRGFIENELKRFTVGMLPCVIIVYSVIFWVKA